LVLGRGVDGEKFSLGLSGLSIDDTGWSSVEKRDDHVTPEMVTELARQALETTLLVSSPILGLSLFVGLVISALQAMTQMNEGTLTFVPKVVVLFVALLFFLPWMLNTMTTYMANLLMSIPNYVY
jgi:flagellar biosynthesis protein FliQ